MPRWRDVDDDDLIRFRCAECGRMLGAKPGMAFVVCSGCRLDNDVPTATEAAESHSQPVRVVSVDVPFRVLVRLGLKVAVAAIPLVLLLTIAACLAVQCIPTNHARNPEPPPVTLPTVTPPDTSEPPADSPTRPDALLGIGGLLLIAFGLLFTAAGVVAWRDRTESRSAVIIGFGLVAVVPLVLGGVMCWRCFA